MRVTWRKETRLGVGLCHYMLKDEELTFVKQCGCSDVIIHLVNYYDEENDIAKATDEKENYGIVRAGESVWSLNHTMVLQKQVEEKGLNIYGIENFSPADWYDILLDGPKKEEQMEHLKETIRNAEKAGIRCLGHNFSLARVWGHQKTKKVRGGAISTCFHAGQLNLDTRIPKGEIWNMTYAENAWGEYIEDIGYEKLWNRLKWFLECILPVTEGAGVMMALHPDDPPMPFLRGTPRLVYQPQLYQKVLDLVPSLCDGIDFCMGSIQEMTDGNICDALGQYSSRGKTGYAHVKNVRGKVPDYTGISADDGDISIKRTPEILRKNHFEGVLIPDHTPQIQCQDIWHAGMAFVLGSIRAESMGLEG